VTSALHKVPEHEFEPSPVLVIIGMIRLEGHLRFSISVSKIVLEDIIDRSFPDRRGVSNLGPDEV